MRRLRLHYDPLASGPEVLQCRMSQAGQARGRDAKSPLPESMGEGLFGLSNQIGLAIKPICPVSPLREIAKFYPSNRQWPLPFFQVYF